MGRDRDQEQEDGHDGLDEAAGGASPSAPAEGADDTPEPNPGSPRG